MPRSYVQAHGSVGGLPPIRPISSNAGSNPPATRRAYLGPAILFIPNVGEHARPVRNEFFSYIHVQADTVLDVRSTWPSAASGTPRRGSDTPYTLAGSDPDRWPAMRPSCPQRSGELLGVPRHPAGLSSTRPRPAPYRPPATPRTRWLYPIQKARLSAPSHLPEPRRSMPGQRLPAFSSARRAPAFPHTAAG